MRILVTGSSGMIGTALCEELKSRGHEVVGIDRVPKMQSEIVDLLKPVTQDLGKFDMIIHLAANARVYDLVVNPDLALENVITTHNIYEFARKTETKKIIFASSRETYGNGNKLPVQENVASHRKCESPYSVSKIFGEGCAKAYDTCYGIKTKIVRYSNVYGKYDKSDRFIPKLLRTLAKDEPFTIYGPSKVLDFTYIDDCVSGTVLLIENWQKARFDEYNIASGEPSSLTEVAKMAKRMMNSNSEILLGNTLTGEVMSYQASIDRIKELGYSPRVDMKDGLTLSIDWYKNN